MRLAYTTRTLFLASQVVVFALAVSFARQAAAQGVRGETDEGYVTAVHLPDSIEVNGEHVTLTPGTRFGVQGGSAPRVDNPLRDSMDIGMYVKVETFIDPSTNVVTAGAVYVRDAAGKKLSGLGVIDKVIGTGPEPVFRADGYTIRISRDTATRFSGGLKSLNDVQTNTWIRYEGHRDKSGVLVALQAEFSPVDTGKTKAPGSTAVQAAVPAHGAWLDDKGEFRSPDTKVRYSRTDPYCGWHKVPGDPVLQERVLRVGTRVIPAFERELAESDPSKIHFRFYAVDEPEIRTDVSCRKGLILVPKQVVERLRNDDQLAAVLADGVAFNMQWNSPLLKAEDRALLAGEIAGGVAECFAFGVGLGTDAGVGILSHLVLAQMQEQRGRIVLSLLADAGYDPWQAPEAWRLLAPRELPRDLGSLKYPRRSNYQIGVLKLQYGKSVDSATAALTESTEAARQ